MSAAWLIVGPAQPSRGTTQEGIWRRWGFEATTSRSASSDPPDVSILRWSPADPIRMARSGIGSVKPASSMIEVQNRMNAELIGWS